MARPNKKEAIVIKKRDQELLIMVKKGYPLDYICAYFNLTKGRISQIIKNENDKL